LLLLAACHLFDLLVLLNFFFYGRMADSLSDGSSEGARSFPVAGGVLHRQ
jgi:hypothetical protein